MNRRRLASRSCRGVRSRTTAIAWMRAFSGGERETPAADETEACAGARLAPPSLSQSSKTSTVHLYDRSSSLWTRLAGVGADDRIQAIARAEAMRGKRGTAGQRAHALPMQEPGQERLGRRGCSSSEAGTRSAATLASACRGKAGAASSCLPRHAAAESHRRRMLAADPVSQWTNSQDCRKASRSALIVSACVVGQPCGNPLYVFSVPFCRSSADSGPESA
jgi:hypothetical protein